MSDTVTVNKGKLANELYVQINTNYVSRKYHNSRIEVTFVAGVFLGKLLQILFVVWGLGDYDSLLIPITVISVVIAKWLFNKNDQKDWK